MLQQCLKEALLLTEFAGKGINKQIADDLCDRIFLRTGSKIPADVLYSIYRRRLSEEMVSLEVKNTIAQFALYADWQHFVTIQTTEKPKKSKYKSFFVLFLFMVFSALVIYGLKTVIGK